MSILCSMPGRSGDLIWALATVRAIAETYGEPVDLLISQKYGSLVGLIQRQWYIARCHAEADWEVQETAPMTPRMPPNRADVISPYDRVFNLGYETWPHPDLARDIYKRANRDAGGGLKPLRLDLSWIIAPYALGQQDVTVGFTDEHFELKYGIYELLLNRFCFSGMIQQHQEEDSLAKRAGGFRGWNTATETVNNTVDNCTLAVASARRSVVWVGNSPRWQKEADRSGVDWETAASWIAASQVFVGCCSALHVLAVGLGRKVVCVEPQKDRQQDVFWPVGKVGQVKLVLGLDGLPTNDARHLGDAVEDVL